MIWFILFIIGIIRLTIINKGFLAFPDEPRYYYSIFALENLLKGDVSGFWTSIFSTVGRPGDAIVRLIPALGQIILKNRFSIPTDNQMSLIIPALWNIIISLLIIIVFFKISKIIFNNNNKLILSSTVVFSLLTNNNIYLRHMLPYDASLLICLIVLLITLSKKTSPIILIVTGLLTGYAYTVYPGYFWFPIIILLTIINFNKKIIYNFYNGFLYLLCITIPVLLFEFVSKLFNLSYLNELTALSKTIIQGSFSESFIFGPLYLIKIERVVGIGLLILFTANLLLYVLDSIRFGRKYIFDKNNIIFITSILVYLFYAGMGHVGHIFVFYGRILHAFIPFLVWGGFLFLYNSHDLKLKNSILITINVLTIISFFQFFISYQLIEYPRDVLYKYGIATSNIPSSQIYYESTPLRSIPSPEPFSKKTNFPYKNQNNFILVNFCYFYPIDYIYNPYKPKSSQSKIISYPHFLTYPAYTFEGFNPEEREILINRKYKIEVFKNK